MSSSDDSKRKRDEYEEVSGALDGGGEDETTEASLSVKKVKSVDDEGQNQIGDAKIIDETNAATTGENDASATTSTSTTTAVAGPSTASASASVSEVTVSAANSESSSTSASVASAASVGNSEYEQLSGSGPTKLTGSGLGTMESPLILSISQEKVKHVIGSKGKVINDMQQMTGAKIYVNQNFPAGVDRQVCISGTPDQVDRAVELVSKVVSSGPTSIHPNSMSGGPMVERTIECPHAIVGKVIGHNGDIIKEIQSRSGAKVQVHQTGLLDGQPRQVQISGTSEAVDTAFGLVSMIMEGGSLLGAAGAYQQRGGHAAYGGVGGGGGGGGMMMMGGMHPGMMGMGMGMGQYGRPAMYGGGGGGGMMSEVAPGVHKLVMELEKKDVGRVIGKRGENVTKIGQSCGCKIQIVQDVTPCRAEISGQQDRIYQAQRMIQEILSNPDPHAIVSLNGNQGFGGHPGGHNAGGYRGGGNPNPHHAHAHAQGQGHGHGHPAAAGGMNPNPYMQMMNPYMQQMMGAQQQQQQQQQQMGGYPGGPAQAHQLRGVPNPQLGYVNPMQQQQQQQQHHAYGAMAAAAYAPGLSNIAGGGGGGGASIWSEYKTDDGTPYWHNKVTDKTQWERPY